jgi:AraC-like DNA-binding protein
MTVVRRTIFEGELVRIRHLYSRPESPGLGEIERQPADILVLPLAGLFAKHEGPRLERIITPNHAAFVVADKPFRLSYPGRIGDECLALWFDKDELARLLGEIAAEEGIGSPALASHALLSPRDVLARSLLWRRLSAGGADPVEVEERSVALLGAAVRAVCKDVRRAARAQRQGTAARRVRQVEAVKEAIAVHSARPWSLAALARLAHTSPYHLSRVFREEVGAPVHQYLLRTRHAKALEAVLDAHADLTAIALEGGFASHSHFTASFRTLFGVTPTELRRSASSRKLSEVRKIATAQALAAA